MRARGAAVRGAAGRGSVSLPVPESGRRGLRVERASSCRKRGRRGGGRAGSAEKVKRTRRARGTVRLPAGAASRWGAGRSDARRRGNGVLGRAHQGPDGASCTGAGRGTCDGRRCPWEGPGPPDEARPPPGRAGAERRGGLALAGPPGVALVDGRGVCRGVELREFSRRLSVGQSHPPKPRNSLPKEAALWEAALSLREAVPSEGQTPPHALPPPATAEPGGGRGARRPSFCCGGRRGAVPAVPAHLVRLLERSHARARFGRWRAVLKICCLLFTLKCFWTEVRNPGCPWGKEPGGHLCSTLNWQVFSS